MGYLLLAIAIILEVFGTTAMKLSDGFSKVTPSILIFVFYGLSFVAFAYALKHIDMSIAYAIWAGLGVSLIAIIGIVHFKEPVTTFKLVSMGLVIIGVVGLSTSGIHHD